MPKKRDIYDHDVEGYHNKKYKEKARIEDHYMPSMNTINKTKKDDPRLHKRTVYDLAGKDDWRSRTQGGHMAGPIDHVAKNKAAFSDV